MLQKHHIKTQGKIKFSPDMRIALIGSLYNREMTESLEKKCIETLEAHGFLRKHINIFYVPGAFDIPLKCQQIAKEKQYNVIITLGVVIKGDTYHFELVANECARGVMEVSLKYDIPIVFEVLAGSREDMEKRTQNDEYNKGIEAADIALQLMKSK